MKSKQSKTKKLNDNVMLPYEEKIHSISCPSLFNLDRLYGRIQFPTDTLQFNSQIQEQFKAPDVYRSSSVSLMDVNVSATNAFIERNNPTTCHYHEDFDTKPSPSENNNINVQDGSLFDYTQGQEQCPQQLENSTDTEDMVSINLNENNSCPNDEQLFDILFRFTQNVSSNDSDANFEPNHIG